MKEKKKKKNLKKINMKLDEEDSSINLSAKKKKKSYSAEFFYRFIRLFFFGFTQDIKDRVVYGSFKIIYRPISFLFFCIDSFIGFVVGESTHFEFLFFFF
jgi:hypothetical protein